jgi:mRNA-degrading endonuclease YafQ of YafQ-DinJ toxin-antitoxin module
MSDQPIQVQVSQVFRQNLKTLAKKNPIIQKDVQPVVEQLERGELRNLEIFLLNNRMRSQ